ncbi:MAG TPA: DHA2 family efflux MFS transporter permease subunit [Methanocella sp.]
MEQTNLKQLSLEESAYKNRYLILGILLFGLFMGVLDSTMISIGLPTITRHYNVDLTLSQWAITGYLVSMTGLFIFFGKLSERTGKVKMFLAGWLIFGVSSLACGLAPGMNELIIFRIAQGVGSSMVSCVSAAMIYLVFPREEQGKALGLLGVVFGGAALVGPGLGGVIVDHLGWEYMFFVNVPLCAVLLVLAFKYLKIPESTTRHLEMDWIGAATLFVSVASLMLLCTEVAKDMKLTNIMAVYAIAFVLSSVAFLYRERRCARPLLELSIFSNLKFTLPIVCSMLLYVGISVATTLAPFFFQGAMGYTASDVGFISMVVPLFMMFTVPVAGAMYDKRHFRFQAAAGAIIYAIGMLVVGLGVLAIDFWVIILGFAIRGVGVGVFSSPNSIEVMSEVSKDKLALASSVQSTANYMSMMVGVAIATIFVTVSLNQNGYYGLIYLAGSSLLSSSIGSIMIVSAALCVLAAMVSALRNSGQVSRAPVKDDQAGAV